MIKINIFIFLILFTFSAFSQNFRLGFQASPQLTWMNSNMLGVENNDLKPGIKYGLEADIFLAGFPRYSLNTGLFVANHSFSARYNPDEPFFIDKATFEKQVDITFKLNYIEIPLNIKLKSDQFYRMTFYGQFGVTNLINISATATSSDTQLTGNNVSKQIYLYNLGMILGGGMEYDVGGNTSLNFGIQYSNGLTDVTDINNLNEKTTFKSVRLVLGVMF